MVMSDALALADIGIEEPLKQEVEEAEAEEGVRWTATRLRDFFELDKPRLAGEPVGDCHFCKGSVNGHSYFHVYNEMHAGWEHLLCWRTYIKEKAKNGNGPSGNGKEPV